MDILSEAKRNRHVELCIENQIGNENEYPLDYSEEDTSKGSSEGPIPTTPDNPIAVQCPFHDCGRYYDATQFPLHAAMIHKNHPQNYACPICVLEGAAYTVNESTNLLKHLQFTHKDLFNSSPPVETPSLLSLTGTKSNPTIIRSVLTNSPQEECSICFDEFSNGQKVVRLECLCLYHECCFDAWFSKSGKACILHNREDM
uniref:RING-type E3 ubiquitin transferase n=1 Tax=Arcella intermedia TaxID=1963864 RepID=A0A6B2LJB6_9EUKA